MPTPEQIIAAACKVCRVELGDVMGNGRMVRVVRARRVATVVMHEDRQMSFPEITARMGKRSHSTAHEQYQNRHDDPKVAEAVREVRRRLGVGDAPACMSDRLASLEAQVATLRQMVCNRLMEDVK